MKYQQLKKQLLWESGIIAGGLAVMGAFALFLDNFSDNYQKDADEIKNKVHTIIASTNSLNSQYENVMHNGDLLKTIVDQESHGRFTINTEIAKNEFNRFRDQYYLANMHLSLAPITDMQGDYKRSTSVVISSQVSVDFEAVADEYAYGLLVSLENDLPGFSKISGFTLTREGDVNTQALNTITEKGAAPLVRGELKFTWFGIKPMEAGDSGNASQKP